MVALSNFVYVYGGISGCGEGEESHHPMLAETTIERYQPKADVWEPITIAAAPRLAAFSWARLGSKPTDSKMVIFGGSDGNITLQDFHIVDFNDSTVQTKETNFEFNTALGHMVYHGGSDTLHHIGGYNSEGVDYRMKISEASWTQSEKNHSLVMNATGLELMNNSSIYFD